MRTGPVCRWLTNYAQRHDRAGYPLRVWLADWLSGWAFRLGLCNATDGLGDEPEKKR